MFPNLTSLNSVDISIEEVKKAGLLNTIEKVLYCKME